MVFTAFCGRALWRALYRALCKTQFVQFCVWRRGRHILCLWVAAVKMNVSLDWSFGTCKREFVQACVCTSINEKTNLLRLCWWVAALKLRVCLDWGFGKCERELVQACICTSVNKKSFPDWVRVLQKTAILSNSLRRNLHAPFPAIQCCYIALLRKAFKKNSHFGSDAGMHWATTLIKGARGDQVWCDNM